MEEILSADGYKINHTFVSNGSDQLIILSHGITTNKDEDGTYIHFVDEFLSPKFDSIRFDFRGHGESNFPTSEVTVAGEILDFMAVVNWARQKRYSKLFHLGTSFGASITLLATSVFNFQDFSGMIFWNPVINYINTFINPTVEWAMDFYNQKSNEELAIKKGISIPETDFIIGPKMSMEFLHLKPERTVWPISLPLLIIHGDSDTCVPHNDSEKFTNENSHAVKIHTLKGVDHGFDEKLDEAFKISFNWINDI